MDISFQGVNETVVTFAAGTVTAGYPVSVSANKKVENSVNGDAPAGVALHTQDGYAAVQVTGFATLPYSGTAPGLGWKVLAADGAGKVKTAANGRSCLVVSVDQTAGTVDLFL